MTWYQSSTIIFLNMQPPSGSSMNFEIGQSSRVTNIVKPKCNPGYTNSPHDRLRSTHIHVEESFMMINQVDSSSFNDDKDDDKKPRESY